MKLFGVEGVHVLDVSTREDGVLVVDVETDQVLAGCASCGVVAIGHGRRVGGLHDAPCFGRPVLVRWRKRVWRCAEAACPVSTWTEDHGYAGPRSKLTARAICWATDALRHDDTTVSAIARHPDNRPRAPHQQAEGPPRQVPPAGDPGGEVHLAWQVYQRLRAIYHATTAQAGRRLAEQLIQTLHTCPIPEIARLGRTLRTWREQILAYFTTGGVNNGGTEAINGVIEKTRRLAHGFRNFTNYRLRVLLAADGTRPYRPTPNHA